MRYRYLSLAGLLLVSSMLGHTQVQAMSAPLTRSDAAKILLLNRTDHVPLFANNDQFPDIPKGHPQERYLLAAERYGILNADPYTHLLRPDATVNRAEFLKMITLTFGLSENLPYSYQDVKKTDWFAPYAGLAESYSLFSAKNRLLPTTTVTRDDAVLAIATIKTALRKSETQAEEEISKDQAQNKLDLYVVISSKRLKTAFGEAKPKQQPYLAQSPDAKLGELRLEVLRLVNLERERAGVSPLALHPLLTTSAQSYAEEMGDGGFFSHVTPSGKTLKDRIRVSGYYDRSFSEECQCVRGYSLAENLARGQRTPKEAVEAWMKSPSHREAMLSREYQDTGIGIFAGLWVQHFGGIVEPTAMMETLY